jgi:hypothetical protein
MLDHVHGDSDAYTYIFADAMCYRATTTFVDESAILKCLQCTVLCSPVSEIQKRTPNIRKYTFVCNNKLSTC